jgi:hypothetical protein
LQELLIGFFSGIAFQAFLGPAAIIIDQRKIVDRRNIIEKYRSGLSMAFQT